MSILFEKLLPTPIDNFGTPTSDEQGEVEESIQAFVESYQKALLKEDEKEGRHVNGNGSSSNGHTSKPVQDHQVPVPSLNKQMHVAFLRKILER